MTLTHYRAIFRQSAFRRFWLGFTFSVFGDALTRVALTWFVYESTHSAQALGWLMLCYTGPIVLGGFLAGWLLDRFDRRRIIALDNAVRGLAVAIIPVLYALDQLALWHVYLFAAMYGFFMMISLAGGPSLIPSLVGQEQLATANALEMLSFTLGGVIGPVLAGWLIAWIGAPYTVAIDAVSYFTYAWLLTRIDLHDQPQSLSPLREQSYGIRHAIQLLLQNPVLLSTTLMFMAFNIGGGLMAVWLPILADKGLGGGPGLYGSLLGVSALGEVVSALLAGSITFALSLGMLISLAQILSGLALLLLLAGSNTLLVGLGLTLYGGFSAPLTIWAQTLRMQIIPERLRGRAFALLRMLMQSGNPIGGAAGGLLLPLLGMPLMIGLSAIVISIPGMLGFGVRALRVAGAKPE
jgi:MFS family permease